VKWQTGLGILILLFAVGVAVLVTPPKPQPRGPLISAARNGDASRVKDLLADGKHSDRVLTHALAGAVMKGHLEVVRVLIDHGVDVNRIAAGYPPLARACGNGEWDIAEILLEHAADPNLVGGSGNPPLASATSQGNVELMRRLLDCGARIEGRNHHRSTALHVAARNCVPEAVELLLSRGAAVNTRDDEGHTPLYWARNPWGSVEAPRARRTIDILLRAGGE